MADGKVRAWLETHGGKPGVIAAFVGMAEGSNAPLPRPPATRLCGSPDEARQWVESEARAFGVPVEWVGGVFAPEDDVGP
jgi:hypothetical protein